MRLFLLTIHTYIQFSVYVINFRLQCDFIIKSPVYYFDARTITHKSFHISSKLDFFIGVEMVMRHAFICVIEFRGPLMTSIWILMMYNNFSVTVYGAHDRVHIFSDFRLVNVY